jgi:raffinose/stachyose/melibiose transport system substrate-binding protein
MRRAFHRRTSAAVAVVGTAALLLTGCSSGTQANNQDKQGGGALSWSGFTGDTVAEALIKKFEEKNPGTKINFTGLPFPQILSQVNTELVSGTASDIVTVFPGAGNPIAVQTLAKANYLEDLTAQSWTQNFGDASKKVMGTDGKVYFGANNTTIIPAIYNDQALNALGTTAPTSYSKVLDLCKAAKDNGKVAYSLAGLSGGNLHLVAYALTATLVYGENPDFVDEQAAGKVNFSDSQWRAALEKYKEMNDAGCFTENALGTSTDVAQTQVVSGEAVGMINVSNAIATLETAAPQGTTFSTAAFPATDDASQTVLPVGLGAGYGVNAKSKNKDLALKFMDFIMSDEGMQIAVEVGKVFPSQPVANFKPTPALAGVAEQAQGKQIAAFPDQTWPTAAMTQTFSDELQKFLGGQASVENVLKSMDEAYKQ